MAFVRNYAWIETVSRAYGMFTVLAPAVVSTILLDAANESIMIVGHLRITNEATGVAFDTNSRIIIRSGAANTFVELTSVLTAGIQSVTATTGPPGQGDGTYRVFGVIPSVTYADIANSTTYLIPMTTVNSATTLSHGDLICIKVELTTFTATDSVTLNGIRTVCNSSGAAAGPFNRPVQSLNVAAATVNPSPFILDFEGDNSVLGYIDVCCPMFESFPTAVTQGNGNESAMIFRPAVTMQVDSFWLTAAITDAVNAELYFYTDPLGTPAGTLLATIDGDTTKGSNLGGAVDAVFAPITLTANVDYAFAIRSLGTSVVTYPMAFNSINHIGHFGGFGVNDVRATRAIAGNPAFTPVANQVMPWGARQCAISDGAASGGGLIVHPGMNGRLAA